MALAADNVSPKGLWFIIPAGEYEGRWHLRGWFLSAFLTTGPVTGPRAGENQLIGYATCPRCHAMVLSDGSAAHHDERWAHEDWHHRTDYPHPEGP